MLNNLRICFISHHTAHLALRDLFYKKKRKEKKKTQVPEMIQVYQIRDSNIISIIFIKSHKQEGIPARR